MTLRGEAPYAAVSIAAAATGRTVSHPAGGIIVTVAAAIARAAAAP